MQSAYNLHFKARVISRFMFTLHKSSLIIHKLPLENWSAINKVRHTHKKKKNQKYLTEISHAKEKNNWKGSIKQQMIEINGYWSKVKRDLIQRISTDPSGPANVQCKTSKRSAILHCVIYGIVFFRIQTSGISNVLF